MLFCEFTCKSNIELFVILNYPKFDKTKETNYLINAKR